PGGHQRRPCGGDAEQAGVDVADRAGLLRRVERDLEDGPHHQHAHQPDQRAHQRGGHAGRPQPAGVDRHPGRWSGRRAAGIPAPVVRLLRVGPLVVGPAVVVAAHAFSRDSGRGPVGPPLSDLGSAVARPGSTRASTRAPTTVATKASTATTPSPGLARSPSRAMPARAGATVSATTTTAATMVTVPRCSAAENVARPSAPYAISAYSIGSASRCSSPSPER